MDPKDLKSLRILCFGDSLTAGYTRYGLEHYPYADYLDTTLRKFLPSTKIAIDTEGLSGDRVRAGLFLRRIEGKVAKVAKNPYDWVIVLGGTNDLGWGEGPEDVHEGLKKVWNAALDTGANVLACTVIECAAASPSLIKRRDGLNELISNHVQDRYYTLDLCSAVPYFSMDEDLRDKIWDDGLHLTEDGYEMMGDAIASRMMELLQECDDPKNRGKKIFVEAGSKKPADQRLSSLLPGGSNDGVK